MTPTGGTSPESKNTIAPMVDPFGREIRYLRLSVTDRCNLRCVYCMSEDMTFLPKSQILSLEELIEVSETFVELGVQKIRVTGGEPLVRRGIGGFLEKMGQISGLSELALTTNGVLIEKHLDAIIAAGIQRINVSLDSLDKLTFSKLTRFDKLQEVLRGLALAKQAGLQVRLNAVVLDGVNHQDVRSLLEYAMQNNFDLAFIEEMPLGEIHSHQRASTLTPNDKIFASLSKDFNLQQRNSGASISGPAKYWNLAGSNTKLGFISPHSNNFCGDCNRVRLTVEGQLLLCLGHSDSVDLRRVLRSPNYQREILKQAIVDAMQLKPKQHYFDPNDTQIVRFMSATGG